MLLNWAMVSPEVLRPKSSEGFWVWRLVLPVLSAGRGNLEVLQFRARKVWNA